MAIEDIRKKNKRKSVATTIVIILVIVLIIVGIFFGYRTFIGNRDIFDIGHNKFDHAYICLAGIWQPVTVTSWTDYDGDVVQVKTDDGKLYLTQYSNVVLVGGK